MKMGKHCFCQKPLVQTVYEARQMRQVAKEKKLATQMGNQGSAENGLRRAVEVVQAGVIGKPLELHVWTNRPIWPQGLDRPAGQDPVPANLDWDVWLGPAPKRPLRRTSISPSSGAAGIDFGTGALGDMACHTVNMPFRALKLGYPNVVEWKRPPDIIRRPSPRPRASASSSPHREGLPPLKFWWYDGNPDDKADPSPPGGGREGNPQVDQRPPARQRRPHRWREGQGLLSRRLRRPVLRVHEWRGGVHQGNQHEACKAVPQTIPRSPGHMQEWFRMMKDGTPAYSNFDIAAYLAEVVLLGCVALRVGPGRRMEWDGPGMRSPNIPEEAARYVKRRNRPGWEA